MSRQHKRGLHDSHYGWDRDSCKNYIITRAPPTLPVFLQHWIMLEKKLAKEKCNSNLKSNHRPRRERQSTCVKESANLVRSITARYTALEALATIRISGVVLDRYDVHGSVRIRAMAFGPAVIMHLTPTVYSSGMGRSIFGKDH